MKNVGDAGSGPPPLPDPVIKLVNRQFKLKKNTPISYLLGDRVSCWETLLGKLYPFLVLLRKPFPRVQNLIGELSKGDLLKISLVAPLFGLQN